MVKKITNILWKVAALLGTVGILKSGENVLLGGIAAAMTGLCIIFDIVEVFRHG